MSITVGNDVNIIDIMIFNIIVMFLLLLLLLLLMMTMMMIIMVLQVGQFPCSEVRPYSCGRKCGRSLECGNHTCQLDCHVVHGAPDSALVSDTDKGSFCEERGGGLAQRCLKAMRGSYQFGMHQDDKIIVFFKQQRKQE